MGDVLALGGFEGRGRLRKAWGNRQTGDDPGIPELTVTEYIGCSGQRGELKHLSIRRNRKKNRFPGIIGYLNIFFGRKVEYSD